MTVFSGRAGTTTGWRDRLRRALIVAVVLAVAAFPLGLADFKLLQVTLALCIVLGAIFLCSWLARRMRNIGVGHAGTINVVAEVRLGPKERAVLLQVGTAQLLLGVAPGQVTALHLLTEPLSPQSTTAPGGNALSFKSLLRKSLGK